MVKIKRTVPPCNSRNGVTMSASATNSTGINTVGVIAGRQERLHVAAVAQMSDLKTSDLELLQANAALQMLLARRTKLARRRRRDDRLERLIVRARERPQRADVTPRSQQTTSTMTN